MRIALLIIVSAVFWAGTVHAQSTPGISEDALDRLRAEAESSHSDAVFIRKDGNVIADWTFGNERRPVEIMSVHKSLVSLAIGRLLTLGLVDSLDQPVYTFYPEWNQGLKKQITLRHLLNHTSGIQNVQSAGVEIYPSPDAVQLALAADLESVPGTSFSYNNKAVNLLAGIIEKASGQRMDQFFGSELFAPLDIDEYRWYFDASGRPHAMAGLRLLAADLAKFGTVVLNVGMWNGNQLISTDYIAQMLEQGQPYDPRFGLLWWRLPDETHYAYDRERRGYFADNGVRVDVLDSLAPLEGRSFDTASGRDDALAEVLGTNWQAIQTEHFSHIGSGRIFRREHGTVIAFYGDGYLGQTLLIVPKHNLVAVRQISSSADYNPETDGFSAFKELVLDLPETDR